MEFQTWYKVYIWKFYCLNLIEFRDWNLPWISETSWNSSILLQSKLSAFDDSKRVLLCIGVDVFLFFNKDLVSNVNNTSLTTWGDSALKEKWMKAYLKTVSMNIIPLILIKSLSTLKIHLIAVYFPSIPVIVPCTRISPVL